MIRRVGKSVLGPLRGGHTLRCLDSDGFKSFWSIFIMENLLATNDGIATDSMRFVDLNVVTQIKILTTIRSRPSPDRATKERAYRELMALTRMSYAPVPGRAKSCFLCRSLFLK